MGGEVGRALLALGEAGGPSGKALRRLPRMRAAMTRRCPSARKSARMRVGEGSVRTLAASTTIDCAELVSSGMNSMPAPSRGARKPAEPTVTCSICEVATSVRFTLSPCRLNQAM
jgi:hypothetical protein